MSLYADLLGLDFNALPAALTRIHERCGLQRYTGEASVARGKGVLAGACAAVSGLPPTYAGAIEVEILADPDFEQWTRRFGAHAMRSHMHAQAGFLRERLGLVCFDFRLSVVDQTIDWRVAAVSVLGLRLPTHWFSGVKAVESIRDSHYHFDVRAALPGIGLLIHYSGWLDPRLNDGETRDG
jgi:Domain of unknown function (DUF4166)